PIRIRPQLPRSLSAGRHTVVRRRAVGLQRSPGQRWKTCCLAWLFNRRGSALRLLNGRHRVFPHASTPHRRRPMRWRNRLYGGVLAAVAVGLGACSQDSSMEPQLSPNEALFSDVPTGYIDVHKFGPAGTYEFEASATVPDPLRCTSFTLNAGGSRQIWVHTNPLLPPSDLTVTELVPEGMQVDSIVVVVYTGGRLTQWQRYTDTNSATAYGLTRSEERRVGKECRCRRSRDQSRRKRKKRPW